MGVKSFSLPGPVGCPFNLNSSIFKKPLLSENQITLAIFITESTEIVPKSGIAKL